MAVEKEAPLVVGELRPFASGVVPHDLGVATWKRLSGPYRHLYGCGRLSRGCYRSRRRHRRHEPRRRERPRRRRLRPEPRRELPHDRILRGARTVRTVRTCRTMRLRSLRQRVDEGDVTPAVRMGCRAVEAALERLVERDRLAEPEVRTDVADIGRTGHPLLPSSRRVGQPVTDRLAHRRELPLNLSILDLGTGDHPGAGPTQFVGVPLR